MSRFEITDISYTQEFENSVEQKVIAQQKAIEEQNRTKQIEEQARQKVLSAEAEAKSMQIRAEALEQNAKLVEWEAVQKWNGVLPQYMLGSGATPFINLNPGKNEGVEQRCRSIFDCDGVLVDSEWLASRVEAELLRELGLELSVEEAHELFLGKTVGACLNIVAARSGSTSLARVHYNWAFATAHAFMRELKPIPYVRAALEELRGRGCPLAVASQSPLARVRLSLEVTGLGGNSSVSTSTSPAWCRIPSPLPISIYSRQRGWARRPRDCVVIEDSPAGAAAARGAGMHAIGYAPGATADAMRANGIAVHALHGRAAGPHRRAALDRC